MKLYWNGMAALTIARMLHGVAPIACAQSAQGNGPTDTSPPTTPADRLSQLRGMIAPPKTHDPSVIRPPNPGPDSMPLIKPPGGSGGDQEIQPK